MTATQSEVAPIRVLHLNDSLEIGGAETMILSLLKALESRAFIPMVCSMDAGGALVSDFLAAGIPVFSLNKKHGIDLGLISRLASLLRREKVHVLHTHNFFAWFYGGIAARLVPGVRHVHTQHSSIVMSRDPGAIVKFVIGKLPKRIVAVSEQVAISLEKKGYARSRGVQVIHNGIDLERFGSSNKTAAAPAEEVVIGIVARLAEVKNHAMLLKAFARVRGMGAKARLKIVGDGPLRTELEALSGKLGISGEVEFLGARGDVENILKEMDVFALSSKSEGMPMSILEAMAAGLPVIATSVGGNPLLVKDNETGILVPNDDEDALTDALSRLISDKNLRKKLGEQARQEVEAKFSVRRMASDYENVYRHVADRAVSK